MKANLIICLLLFGSFSSLSQTIWYKYPGNPVIKYEEGAVWDQVKLPLTVLFEDGQYHLWYKGWSANKTNFIGIGYITSTDGIHWQKHGPDPLDFRCHGDPWDLECCYRSFDIIKTDTLSLLTD